MAEEWVKNLGERTVDRRGKGTIWETAQGGKSWKNQRPFFLSARGVVDENLPSEEEGMGGTWDGWGG